MDLKLVNELSESKLYRQTRSFNVLSGQDVADLLYLNTLGVLLLADAGGDYAKKTAQYPTYSLFRSYATDLYMLGYQASNPDNDRVKLRDNALESMQFDGRRHNDFMREVGMKRATAEKASTYLMRLESQLKIKDSRYKVWRRDIVSGRHDERLFKDLARELKRLSHSNSEMGDMLAPASKLKRAAGTAASAVIGRAAGDKLNKKNLGTGLGAIAGYWASGKR